MHAYTIYKLVDVGGWGAERTDIACILARTETIARIRAFEALTGKHALLSLLSSFDVELITKKD